MGTRMWKYFAGDKHIYSNIGSLYKNDLGGYKKPITVDTLISN